MKDEKTVSRRNFLKFAGGFFGGGVLLCGGGAYLGLQTPSSVSFPMSTCGHIGGDKVLVAYASKCGATGEIAERIAETLCSSGMYVELDRARNLKSVEEFSSVVLGTAIYMGKPLGEAVDFAENFLAAQSDKRIALFDVCLTMKENTSENVQAALGYLDVFKEFFTPSLIGAFAGRIDFTTLSFLYRTFAQADKEGILAEGEFRDWDKIEAWAGSF